jgi:hypothetical protein
MNAPRTDPPDPGRTRTGALLGRVLPALSVLLLFVPAPLTADEPPPVAAYTSATECGRCHHGLYQSWQLTFHAQAVANPDFLVDMDKIEKKHGPVTRVVCLSCHSPTSALTMDYSLASPLAREGVTCDFCHTVSTVESAGQGLKIVNDLSPVKAGPGGGESIPAHRTRRNAALLSADFCAACHQWVNGLGLPILDTMAEWKAGPYPAENKTCQYCHMPEVLKADVFLDGKIVERPSHLHFEMGGHSQTQVATAAGLILESKTVGSSVEAIITVSNARGGHALPTGMPSRTVALDVTLLDRDGKLVEHFGKVYRRVIGDSAGNELKTLAEWYDAGARVIEDTRLAAREKRVERFSFHLPTGAGPVILQARLSYRVPLSGLSSTTLDYEMASARKVISDHGTLLDLVRVLAFSLAVALIFIVVLILARLKAGRDDDR